MTLEMKIQMEREDAAIKSRIETAREFGISDEELIQSLMLRFGLTEEEAGERIREYENAEQK